MVFEELQAFQKDKKKLTKKYRSIPDDLETVKQVLEILPDERPPFSFRINNLGIETCIIKIKKIACKSLKGKGINSGLRLVYAHFTNAPEDSTSQASSKNKGTDRPIEKLILIELFHKSDKAHEDRNRILKHFK